MVWNRRIVVCQQDPRGPFQNIGIRGSGQGSVLNPDEIDCRETPDEAADDAP